MFIVSSRLVVNGFGFKAFARAEVERFPRLRGSKILPGRKTN
jgi:hypothetical protein